MEVGRRVREGVEITARIGGVDKGDRAGDGDRERE